MNPPFLARTAAALLTLSLATVSVAEEKSHAERDGELLAASNDAAIVRAGRDSYAALCQSCHGDEKARGTLGEAPSNLFDRKWYHGGAPHEIEHTILNGYLDKGMPPWKDALPPEDTTAIAAYLLSFQKSPAASNPAATPASP